MKPWSELSKRAQVAYVFLVVAWSVLLLYQIGIIAVYGEPWIVWVGRLGPLLLFAFGLFERRPRSIIWLCFVSLMYFIAGVERLFATPSDWLAWLAMDAIVSIFVAGMLYVRWQSRDQRAEG
ncbi:MAG: DUF2069 domain-containing protein [Aequoribacter sp.]|uniref:DUF2069 domain-containing protein n=1 Tax=Aequoribacter sp. TaxID=2847771 RepID=UPI003C53FB63